LRTAAVSASYFGKYSHVPLLWLVPSFRILGEVKERLRKSSINFARVVKKLRIRISSSGILGCENQ